MSAMNVSSDVRNDVGTWEKEFKSGELRILSDFKLMDDGRVLQLFISFSC